MSADNREGALPSNGALGAGTGTPAEPSVEPGGAGDPLGESVITSHGEREARAYVAPIEVPKRQRLKTMDMAKVRISADMKVEIADTRHMPTTKMELPPGGLRPPPPPQAEVSGPASSPWTASAGIDRSMLPSASLGPAMPPPGSRSAAQQSSQDDEEGGRGLGIWIGVVLIAALLGGGAAYLLRGKVAGSNTSGVSSSAPIAVTVPTTPGKVPLPPVTAEPASSEPATTAEPEPTEDTTAAPSTSAAPAQPGVKPVTTAPRRPPTTKPTATATPTTTGSAPKRLF